MSFVFSSTQSEEKRPVLVNKGEIMAGALRGKRGCGSSGCNEVDSIFAATEMHVLMLQKWKHPVLPCPVINSKPKGKGTVLVLCRTAGQK